MKKGRKTGEKNMIRFDIFTFKKEKEKKRVKGKYLYLGKFLYPLLDPI